MMSRYDGIDQPGCGDTNLGDPRETMDEKEISRLNKANRELHADRDEAIARMVKAERALTASQEREGMLREEHKLLTDVLTQARRTLLTSINGTPEALGESFGKLNLVCLAHWKWQTTKFAKP